MVRTGVERARVRAALATMIRLSPTLAREVKMLAEWGITVRVVPGGGASTYTAGDSTINLSEAMNGSLTSMTEVLSHEGGHAVWDKSGIGTKVTDALIAQGVDPSVANIVNEGFAGIFGNRAYLALHGRDGSGNLDNLAIAHDILGNLANDETFYADYYNVDTAKARSQWEIISAVLRDNLVPGVTSTFGLENDPDLTRGL